MSNNLRHVAAVAVCTIACATARSADANPEGQLHFAGRTTLDSVVVTHTGSLALDRITKRDPAPNGIVAHSGTGRGVTIYVFDGGVAENHPELAGRVRIGFDAFPSDPRICNAHGTAVAGAAAGATLGVAREAVIVDVKIIDCARKRGSVEAIVDAARWTARDYSRHPGHPAIANWSFVVDTSRVIPGIDSAVAILRNAGILVVASAGNFDIDACRVSPANSRRTLVVGASALVRSSALSPWLDVRANETAWGPCIDIYAPGESVLLPGVENGKPNTSLWNGTSMAAGYVSGAAAIVLERNHLASPEAVMQTLERYATANVVDERNVLGVRRRAPLLYVGATP